MAESLDPLLYGTVVGRFLVQLADSTDVDLKPDILPARGYLTFTPATTYANVKEAEPDPATIFPQTVYGVLDDKGYLCSVRVDSKGIPMKSSDGSFIPVERGIRMQASSDPSLIPTNWTWNVSFNLTFNNQVISYPSFNFTLDPNQEVDLAYVKPTDQTSGTITITGPRGARGNTGPKGDTGPVNVLKIGKIETVETGGSATASITGDAPNQTLNLGIPRGPVGPSGGPIPVGGTAGQIVRKNSDGGFEWFSLSNHALEPTILDGESDLNTYDYDFIGYQPLSENAKTELNYPAPVAGMLRSYAHKQSGMCWQFFDTNGTETDSSHQKQYRRTAYNNTWSPWTSVVRNGDFATDSSAGLMSAEHFSALQGATSGFSANNLVKRDGNGDFTAGHIYSSSTDQPSSDYSYTKKKYVDSEITSAKVYSYDLTSKSSSDLDTLTTAGTYFVDGNSANAPKLVGLTFGGLLEVYVTKGGGLNRGIQRLTVNVVRENGGNINNWGGSNGADFFGAVFTRSFTYLTSGYVFHPWKMHGETPPRENGITVDRSRIATIRYPIQRSIRDGNLRVWGTCDLASSFRSGVILTLDPELSVVTKQITANTEAEGGFGKFQIKGTAGSFYLNKAGVNWVTFDGEWILA